MNLTFEYLCACVYQGFVNLLRSMKFDHNKQWPSHKQEMLANPLFCDIDFVKSPQWGLEGHIAICDVLLGRNTPPVRTAKARATSCNEVHGEAKAAAKAKERLIKPITSTAKSKAALKTKNNRETQHSMVHQEHPQSTDANERHLAQSSNNIGKPKVLHAMARRINAGAITPPAKRATKEYHYLSVGQTVFVSIEEWFTLAAPCPSEISSRLYIRGEVVMSYRNNAKFTISFPQLGRFIDESVLTRSSQYFEVCFIFPFA